MELSYNDGIEIRRFEISKSGALYQIRYTTLLGRLKEIVVKVHDPEYIGQIIWVENILYDIILPYTDRLILYISDLNEIITNLKIEDHGISD